MRDWSNSGFRERAFPSYLWAGWLSGLVAVLAGIGATKFAGLLQILLVAVAIVALGVGIRTAWRAISKDFERLR